MDGARGEEKKLLHGTTIRLDHNTCKICPWLPECKIITDDIYSSTSQATCKANSGKPYVLFNNKIFKLKRKMEKKM